MNQGTSITNNDSMENVYIAQKETEQQSEVDVWFDSLIDDTPDSPAMGMEEGNTDPHSEQAWGTPISQPDRYMNMMQGTEGGSRLSKEEAEEVNDTFSEVLHNLSEVPYAVASGAVDGVNEAIDLIYALGGKLTEITPEWDHYYLDVEVKDSDGNWQFPKFTIKNSDRDGNPIPPDFRLDPPDTTSGQLVHKISQFLTGFVSGGIPLKWIKAAGAGGQLIKGAIKGAIADFAFFDAQEERFSNLMLDMGIQNEFFEYLAAQEGDGEFEGRFKNTLEGLGLGTLAEGLFMVAKSLRKAKIAKSALDSGLDPVADAVSNYPPPNKTGGIGVLGDVNKPLLNTIEEIQPEDILPPIKTTAHEQGVTGLSKSNQKISVGASEHLEINFSRIDSPEDIHQVMQTMADTFKGDIDTARRGVRSFKQIQLSAEQENAWKILAERRQGEPLNAEQSLAARNLWATSADKLSSLAKLAAQNPNEENLFAFRKMLSVHYAIQKEVIAARTETARALASWRIPSGSHEHMMREMTQALDFSGGADVSRELAARIAKLSEAGMSQEIEAIVEQGLFAKTRAAVQEAWIMGLLSNPKTHLVNMMGNTLTALTQVFERGVAARIGQVLGDETGVQIGEGLAMLHGMKTGFKSGLNLAWKSFKYNEAGGWAGKIDLPHNPAISSESLRVAKDTTLGKAVDVVGTIVRTPGRALMAEDEFFKAVNYSAQINAEAFRMASREVSLGKIPHSRMQERVSEIIANPPEHIKFSGMDYATYSTFQNTPGKFALSWMRLTHNVPELKIITPFIKTPANIFNYAIAERSPFAPLFRSFREDISAGGAKKQLALAKMSTGTMLMMTAVDMAFSGQVTGGGPANPAEKQALLRTGWQPYSVKVGDRYFSFSRMDPVGITFGIAGDLVEIANHMDHEDKEVDVDEAAIYFAASIANSAMSKNYMKGMAGFVEMVGNPKAQAQSFAQRMAGSLVPAVVGEVARQTNPFMVEVNSTVEAMKARIPGLSKDLPVRRDLWGRPMKFSSGMGVFYDAISPIASRRHSPEPIDEEMLRLGAYVSTPKKKVSFDGVTIDLTRFDGAYSRYVELAGNGLKHPVWRKGCMDYLNDVVTGKEGMSGLYKLRSDGDEGGKIDFIRSTIYDYRMKAKKQLMKEYPELREYVEQKKAAQGGKWDF